jgi:hypothetical protein
MQAKKIILLVALGIPALVGILLVLFQGSGKQDPDQKRLKQLAKAREKSIEARRARAEARKAQEKPLDPEPDEDPGIEDEKELNYGT